jgi:hypothetical protein
MVVRITSRHSTTGKQHLSSLIREGRYHMVVRITSRHSTTGKQHLSSLIRGGRYHMVVRITSRHFTIGKQHLSSLIRAPCTNHGIYNINIYIITEQGYTTYIVTPVICFARIEILQLIFELGLLCLTPLSTIYSVISW